MHGPFEPTQEQALATFNHAAEEMRFFKGQQWRVTNYTLAAYAALAAAPSWLEPASWQCSASWGSFALVPLASLIAWWVLANLELSIKKERRRLHAARLDLRLMCDIHRTHTLEKIRSEIWWRRRFWRREHEWGTDRGPTVPWVFFAVLVAGLIVANTINLSGAFHACSGSSNASSQVVTGDCVWRFERSF